MWDINVRPLGLLQAPEGLQKEQVICLLFYDSWKKTGSGVKVKTAAWKAPILTEGGWEFVQDAGFLLATSSGCGKF